MDENFNKFLAIIKELESKECDDRGHRLYITKELISLLVELKIFKDETYVNVKNDN